MGATQRHLDLLKVCLSGFHPQRGLLGIAAMLGLTGCLLYGCLYPIIIVR